VKHGKVPHGPLVLVVIQNIVGLRVATFETGAKKSERAEVALADDRDPSVQEHRGSDADAFSMAARLDEATAL
jgi:hypothetical protein